MAQIVSNKRQVKKTGWTSYLLLPAVILGLVIALLAGMFVYVYSKRNVARIVRDIPITERQISVEIDSIRKENPSFKPPTNASQAELDESYKQSRNAALTRRMNMALVELEAREKGLDNVTNADVNKRMEENLQYYGMTEEQYLVENNITKQEFFDQTREQLVYEAVTKDIYKSVKEPSRNDLLQYFDNVKSNYEIGETADFYMCQVKNMEDANKVLEDIVADQKKGLKIEEAMKNAVKKHTTDPESKKTDGLMRDIPKEYFYETPEIANAIFPATNIPKEAQLTVGVVQPIITQKKGVYIILLLKKNPAQKPNLDGEWSLYNTQTQKTDKIKIIDMVKDAWIAEQGNSLVLKHINELSNLYEDEVYDRVKGNLPWSGLEKFYESLLGSTTFSKLMGWEQ